MASDRAYLLVDGNNVIYAWDELTDLHRRSKGLAHERLEHLLGHYQDVSGVRVVLVFDGRRDRMEAQPERDEHEVQVFYSDSSHTADDIIERLSAKYAARHRITVATNDLAEQNTVYSLGTEVISPTGLRHLLESAQSSTEDWLNRYRRKGGN